MRQLEIAGIPSLYLKILSYQDNFVIGVVDILFRVSTCECGERSKDCIYNNADKVVFFIYNINSEIVKATLATYIYIATSSSQKTA